MAYSDVGLGSRALTSAPESLSALVGVELGAGSSLWQGDCLISARMQPHTGMTNWWQESELKKAGLGLNP